MPPGAITSAGQTMQQGAAGGGQAAVGRTRAAEPLRGGPAAGHSVAQRGTAARGGRAPLRAHLQWRRRTRPAAAGEARGSRPRRRHRHTPARKPAGPQRWAAPLPLQPQRAHRPPTATPVGGRVERGGSWEAGWLGEGSRSKAGFAVGRLSMLRPAGRMCLLPAHCTHGRAVLSQAPRPGTTAPVCRK